MLRTPSQFRAGKCVIARLAVDFPKRLRGRRKREQSRSEREKGSSAHQNLAGFEETERAGYVPSTAAASARWLDRNRSSANSRRAHAKPAARDQDSARRTIALGFTPSARAIRRIDFTVGFR
ncbi:MAG: hypothetical protein KDB80_01650, partial [Planctomycetes bacterium]|nr:hypothetical protein [Planctomycetota bacterium]